MVTIVYNTVLNILEVANIVGLKIYHHKEKVVTIYGEDIINFHSEK